MILLIDTATARCSVALSEGAQILQYREAEGRNVHAAMVAPLIKEVLEAQGVKASDLAAVCVSKGPGSYTGLRVGVSTAKGICFGAGVPLLAVGTLDALVAQAFAEGLVPEGCTHIVPMIDARRMEVYCAVYDAKGRAQTEVAPQVIDSDSFADLFAEGGKVLFIGDGAEKCREALGGQPGAVFAPCCPKASSLAIPAAAALSDSRFENVAYFEPFYLKDFIATVSRKNLF